MIRRLVNTLFHPRPISIAEWLEGMRRLDAEFPLPPPKFAPGLEIGKPGVSARERKTHQGAAARRKR